VRQLGIYQVVQALMGFSLWNIFKAGLLLINAVLILHRKRFLHKYRLDDVNSMNCHPSEISNLRIQVIGLLQAVSYLKVPIIAANMITIIFELLLGGA
jgi:uncharacterized protein with PQ loop repeat